MFASLRVCVLPFMLWSAAAARLPGKYAEGETVYYTGDYKQEWDVQSIQKLAMSSMMGQPMMDSPLIRGLSGTVVGRASNGASDALSVEFMIGRTAFSITPKKVDVPLSDLSRTKPPKQQKISEETVRKFAIGFGFVIVLVIGGVVYGLYTGAFEPSADDERPAETAEQPDAAEQLAADPKVEGTGALRQRHNAADPSERS
jgi:hypothetical protein